MDNPQGAYVTIQWLDDDSIVDGYYVHFGDIPEEGVNDDHVFYYCDDVVDLERLKHRSNCLDFIVLDYELVTSPP